MVRTPVSPAASSAPFNCTVQLGVAAVHEVGAVEIVPLVNTDWLAPAKVRLPGRISISETPSAGSELAGLVTDIWY